jgi:hypothetical protein
MMLEMRQEREIRKLELFDAIQTIRTSHMNQLAGFQLHVLFRER